MSKTKTIPKSKAKPKHAKEKSKLRSALTRPGDRHRVSKLPAPPSKSKANQTRKPMIIDLTSSSPPTKPPPKRTTATPKPKKVALLPSSERSPGIHSPITRSLSLSLGRPLGIPDPTKATQPPEYYIQPIHVRDITPGTVVWLPSKEDIVHNAYVDPKLHVNAFDHPAVIISTPTPLTIFSVVEIAIVCLRHFLSLCSPYNSFQ